MLSQEPFCSQDSTKEGTAQARGSQGSSETLGLLLTKLSDSHLPLLSTSQTKTPFPHIFGILLKKPCHCHLSLDINEEVGDFCRR